MNRKVLSNVLAISGIGAVGFLAGATFENRRTINSLELTSDPYILYSTSNIKKVGEHCK